MICLLYEPRHFIVVLIYDIIKPLFSPSAAPFLYIFMILHIYYYYAYAAADAACAIIFIITYDIMLRHYFLPPPAMIRYTLLFSRAPSRYFMIRWYYYWWLRCHIRYAIITYYFSILWYAFIIIMIYIAVTPYYYYFSLPCAPFFLLLRAIWGRASRCFQSDMRESLRPRALRKR